MKVALITTNLTGGGAERVFLRWAELLGARGHDVRVILLEHRIDHAVPDSVKVHALTLEGKTCSKGFLGKRVAAWRLRSLLKKPGVDKPFDLHVSTLPFADEVVAIAKLPRCWYRIANTLSAEVKRLNKAKGARRLSKYQSLYRDKNLIAVSDGVAQDLREALRIAASHIVRIYNPYDFAAVRGLAMSNDGAIPQEPFIIHVGRFRPQKRHDLLFQAFAQSEISARLVLLCEPDPKLNKMLTKAGLDTQVIVAGFKQNPYPWIRAARCLVLCSDHEGLPNVLIGALVCGTPVVSTDCPSGPREILTGSLVHWLVPHDDAPRLAQALRAVIAQPRWENDGELQQFAASAIVHQIESLIAER